MEEADVNSERISRGGELDLTGEFRLGDPDRRGDLQGMMQHQSSQTMKHWVGFYSSNLYNVSRDNSFKKRSPPLSDMSKDSHTGTALA